MVTLMAVMLLMAIGVTSFAASKSKTEAGITGNISVTRTSCTARSSASGDTTVFASAKIQYRTSSGSTYWSSAAENTGAGYTSTSRSAGSGNTGIQGESAHGRSKNAIQFTLTASAS